MNFKVIKQQWHIILTYAFLIGSTLTLVYTFFIAYFNGYKVTLYINNYGEAHIEFMLIIFSIIVSCFVLIQYFRSPMQRDKPLTVERHQS
jgi:integral membrane sensor domain MASE1